MAKGNSKKPSPPKDVYERNTRRAEIAGWLIVVGLGVELGSMLFAGRPLSELIPQAIADLLIAGGVAFELLFARIARIAGDTAQAEANARAAEAELQTERLRKEIAWRRLSEDEVRKLSEFLAPLPKFCLRVLHLTNDPESSTFACDIGATFRQNGWRVMFITSTFHGEVIPGMIIPLYSPPDLDACGITRTAMAHAGIQFMGGTPPAPMMLSSSGDEVSSPQADIYVGPKPRPNLG